MRSLLNRLNLPPWVKRLGVFALPIVGLFLVAKIAIEAIFQQEVTTWWGGQASPFLNTRHNISVSPSGWTITTLIICIVVVLTIVAYLSFHFYRTRETIKKAPRFEMPKDIDKYEFNSTDVITAIDAARKGKLNQDMAADLVIRAVNLSKITPKAATEALGGFNYDLIPQPDGTYKKAKKRRVR